MKSKVEKSEEHTGSMGNKMMMSQEEMDAMMRDMDKKKINKE